MHAPTGRYCRPVADSARNVGVIEGLAMLTCVYLKDHTLSKDDLDRFKKALAARAVVLEAQEFPGNGDLIKLSGSTGPGLEMIRITTETEKITDLQFVCRRFGFVISKESTPESVKPVK
jgi:hypothetical protein